MPRRLSLGVAGDDVTLSRLSCKCYNVVTTRNVIKVITYDNHIHIYNNSAIQRLMLIDVLIVMVITYIDMQIFFAR